MLVHDGLDLSQFVAHSDAVALICVLSWFNDPNILLFFGSCLDSLTKFGQSRDLNPGAHFI
jgi:hypothetical protein